MLEGQYGDLIAKRSELKGISKKPELLATKKEIAVRITIRRFLKLSKTNAILKFAALKSKKPHRLKILAVTNYLSLFRSLQTSSR